MHSYITYCRIKNYLENFKHNFKDINNIILSYIKCIAPSRRIQTIDFINYPKVNALPQVHVVTLNSRTFYLKLELEVGTILSD